MADIVMPLRYIISASARWASVRIVCFRVILLANLVPSSYGHLLPALSIETSPLSSLSSIEAQQSQALLTFFKLSVEMRTSGFKAAARRTLMHVSVRLRLSVQNGYLLAAPPGSRLKRAVQAGGTADHHHIFGASVFCRRKRSFLHILLAP